MQHLLGLDSEGDCFRGRCGRDDVCSLVLSLVVAGKVSAMPGAPPQLIEALVRGDLEQPGAVRPELVAVTPSGDEGLLAGVFSGEAVLEQA